MTKDIKIGIPRALLYHYYSPLWLNFFKNLGIKTITSPETNREIIKQGVANAVDEGCFSSKVYLGHVKWLIGKCDMIFVPRIECVGIREEYCTRIFGLYDLVKNTFPGVKLLHADTNILYRKRDQDAFLKVGAELGKTPEQTAAAYADALDKFKQTKQKEVEEQNKLLESGKLKVLVVSHAYNTYDACIGKNVLKYFNDNNITVIQADIVDISEAKTKTKEIYGNRIYWKVNSEILGGIELYKDRVDGIVLISTFPCGPDSIFNELVIRKTKNKPILSLMIDELDATAGMITRLESFTDILAAMKKGAKNAK